MATGAGLQVFIRNYHATNFGLVWCVTVLPTTKCVAKQQDSVSVGGVDIKPVMDAQQ
jgi:hypothetical protein